jgi:hypothetical protein
MNCHIDFTFGKWYFLIMNRMQTVKRKMMDHRNDDYVPGTPEERILLVWPLTREIASLSVKHDVERRLQRHVTRIDRRESQVYPLMRSYGHWSVSVPRY